MLKSSAQYLVLIAIFVDVVAAFSSTVVETTGVQRFAITFLMNYLLGDRNNPRRCWESFIFAFELGSCIMRTDDCMSFLQLFPQDSQVARTIFFSFT